MKKAFVCFLGIFICSNMFAFVLPEGTDGSFIKKSVGQVMVDLDYNSNGGAILLGCKKPIAKIHGSANANTISAVIGQMIKMYETEMISKVSAALEQLKKD